MALPVRDRSVTLYSNGSGGAPLKQYRVLSNTIQPRCAVRTLRPRKGDVVTYSPSACINVDTGTAATISLDSDGVPTITGAYGVYDFTFTFNGTSLTKQISHTNKATVLATFSLPSQDSDGFSVFTPDSTSRLIYVDTTLGNDSTAGPSGNSTDDYTGASPPTGGWEQPSSVNAWATIEAAKARRRDGFGDWILLKRGETFVPTETISYSGIEGASATNRQMLIAYGDPTAARPIINPAAELASPKAVVYLQETGYVGLVGLDFYPSFRDPASGDWGGWATSGMDVEAWKCLGHPDTANSGFIIEDCRMRYTDGGGGITGSLTVTDFIFRRNVVVDAYSVEATCQGLGMFTVADEPIKTLIEDNIFIHNGWYRQRYNLTGTATAGSTTTLTHTGAFAGLDLATVELYDVTNADWTFIVSNTDDVVTFTASGTVDFTGGGDYEIGVTAEGEISGVALSQGQASLLNHNIYISGLDDSLVRNNISADPSSGIIKITSAPGGTGEQSENLIFEDNLGVYGEFVFSAGGNTADGDTRFKDIQYVDNVQVNTGINQPTNRTLGFGWSVQDWNAGVMGNNIIKDSGNATVTNLTGLRMAGQVENVVIAHNKLINLGASSGSSTTQGPLAIEDQNLSGVSNRQPSTFTNNRVIKNDFQQPDSDGIITNWLDAYTSGFAFEANRYHASRGDTDSYVRDSSADTYANWIAETGETSPENGAVDYADISASIENYQLKRGGTGTIAAYLTECRSQKRGNWDSTLEAEEITAYFRDCLQDRPDIKFEVVQDVLLSAVAGTQFDINFSTGFGTPKALIGIRSGTWNGFPSNEANGNFTIFATDGTNQVMMNPQIDSENTPTTKAFLAMCTDVLCRRNQSGTSQEAYDFVSFGTDKVTLEVVDDSGREYETIFIGITGDDIDSISVGTGNLGTGTSPVEITTGQQTDLLLAFTGNTSTLNTGDGRERECYPAIGVAVNGDSIQQRCIAYGVRDDLSTPYTPSECTSAVYNDSILARVADGATETYSAAVTDFTQTGVYIQPDASASSAILGFVSIKMKKRVRMSLTDTSIPTSGSISTAIGHQARTGLWFNLAGPSSRNTAADAGMSFGITAIDESGSYTSNITAKDNTTQTDHGAYARIASNLTMLNTAGEDAPTSTTEIAAGNTIGFSRTGTFDATITTNPSSAILGFVLGIG